MENFDINKALRLENYGYSDEHLPNPFEGSSYIFNPLNVFPDPLLSDIPALPPSNQPNVVSPALSEEDAAHVDNLVLFGVDSPVLPPDIQTSAPSTAEMPPALAPPQPPTQPTASSVSYLPVSSALFSPTAAFLAPSISPPAYQRRESFINEPDQPQAPTPGPSSRPTRTRSRAFYPGESSFQLDRTVAPLRPSSSPDRPVANPRLRPDYLQCKCPGGPTKKPHRHWKTCPDNPNRGQKPFQCEICGERYTTKFNKERHVKREHM